MSYSSVNEIKPMQLIRHRTSGKTYLTISIEWWNNILTGEKQHVKMLSEDNEIVEFGLGFVASEFVVIA